MDSTSRQQEEALVSGDLPPLEQVRDDVWALAQPMPGDHLAYSFTYLLRDSDGGVLVVDPGWDSDENWQRLTGALHQLVPGCSGADVVTGIIGTHLHPDHVGMAGRLREASGAMLGMHVLEREALERHRARPVGDVPADDRLEAWGVPPERRAELAQYVDRSPEGLVLAVDRELADGDVLPVPGFRLEVMATPGHTAGHLCLRDDARGLLLTGDHVLPTVFPGLGLGGETPSNPLADYLASIEAVCRYPDHEVLPGHGYRFTGIAERARECADHHLKRAREVAEVVAAEGGQSGEPRIWDIASLVTWTAGWKGLHGFQLLSALHQTQMHLDFVRSGGHALR